MSSQAAPRRAPGDARERILVAAELLFAERGVDKTSTRDITTEAGVNVASVNYYFRSKEALTEEIFMRLAQRATVLRLADLSKYTDAAPSRQAVAAPERSGGLFHQAVLRARLPWRAARAFHPPAPAASERHDAAGVRAAPGSICHGVHRCAVPDGQARHQGRMALALQLDDGARSCWP